MAAPRTMPVARSLPRTRRTPMTSMTPAPNTLKPTNPSRGLMPSRNGTRPTRRGHVGEGVPGKGLAPHDGEDPDDGRHNGRGCTDDDGDVHGFAGEEAGLDDPGEKAVHGVSCA